MKHAVAGSGRKCSFELTERLSWLRICQRLAGTYLLGTSHEGSNDPDMNCCGQGLGGSAALS